MSKYYRGRRKNGYVPGSAKPFKLSRTRIELFLSCPRCFYYDRRLGVDRPPGFPFALNTAVDTLLKKEFDVHRANGSVHPLMEQNGIDAVPFQHEQLDVWRDALHGGITFHHKTTNLIVGGGIDDLWQNPKGELIIVDYKATAKTNEVTIDEDWQIAYKRQVEIYQWLFRQNGFKVTNRAYFVYANGDTDKAGFDGKLEFEIKVIPYDGDDAWVEPTILRIHKCLNSSTIPVENPDCDYCLYRKSIKEAII